MTNPITRIERHDYRDPLGHPLVRDVDWLAITQADKARGEVDGKFKLWFFRDLAEAHRLALFRLYGLPAEELQTDNAKQRALKHIFTTPQPQGDATDLAIARATIDSLRTRLAACEGALEEYHARDFATPQVSGGGEHVATLREMLCNDFALDEGAGMTGFTAERAAIEAAIAAMSAPQARPDGGAVDALDRSMPERIWLQIDTCGDRIRDRNKPFPRENLAYVSWSWDQFGGVEVEYVRADLAPAPAPDVAQLVEAITEADGCFEAALVEGWLDALADGDIDRIRELWCRRIEFARAPLIEALAHQQPEKGEPT